MKKPTLCLIFGGKSSEHEVSLASVASILNAIDAKKYKIIKIGITKDGRWFLYNGGTRNISNGTWHKKARENVLIDINGKRLIIGKRRVYPDIVLPVLHGENGEDGRLQALFDIAGIKYAGCDFFSSFVCFDKHLAKLSAKKAGIKVAKWALLSGSLDLNEKKAKAFVSRVGFPVFVKPSDAGSSIGVSKVESYQELKAALEKAFKVSKRVLIEEAINGTETEIGVLEVGGKPVFSTPGQIKHGGDFYDYEEKYKNGKTEYIIPAKISDKTKKHLEECAKKLYFELGIVGLSRIDFFVNENQEVIFNEVNTMPGFTEISMFSKLFEHDGFSMVEILSNILNI